MALASARSRFVMPLSIGLCWIAPGFGAIAWAAFARAMISAKERFFGSGLGPVLTAAVILAVVFDGRGRLPLDEDGAGPGFDGVL